jgi:putative FmdB family regulatory protein
VPLYDYKCEACGAEFEVERPLIAKGAVKCACGSSKTSKVFSAAGIVFKGSGFHVTDYRGRPAESKSNGKPVETKAESVKSADAPAAPAKSETPPKSGKDE